jgi:hypothetical protein
MRTKQVVTGLKNTQKIRVMVDGFGMYMQVKDVENICTTNQRTAVLTALQYMSAQKITGFGKRFTVYNGKMESVSVDVQVDLV